jgi:hypothetical protein
LKKAPSCGAPSIERAMVSVLSASIRVGRARWAHLAEAAWHHPDLTAS